MKRLESILGILFGIANLAADVAQNDSLPQITLTYNNGLKVTEM